MASNPYLQSNPRLKFDYRSGRRGWGLLLYGALPSSLAGLGVIDPPKSGRIASSLEEGTLTLILLSILLLVPVAVFALLVRQRLASWYLMRDHLGRRTTIVTLAIFALSFLVSSTAVVLHQPESQAANQQRSRPVEQSGPQPTGGTEQPGSGTSAGFFQSVFQTAAKGFLMTAAFLVGSSTLFLTAIKDSAGLPALPAKPFVEDLLLLRKHLVKILEEPTANNLENDLKEALEVAGRLSHSASGSGGDRVDFFKMLKADLEGLKYAREQIEVEPDKKEEILGDAEPEDMYDLDREARHAVHRLLSLQVSLS